MRILYNPQFSRWEVYSENSVCRNGELQPVYVNSSYEKCLTYQEKVEENA